MSLAILLLAHKNAHQVSRLFQAVYHPDDTFILHFDRRAEPALHQLGRELARDYENVILLPARSILWGGARMSEIQIEAMRVALAANRRWHHFVNLTGQDFPIKSRDTAVARLAAKPDANYISWFDPIVTPLWNNARERLERYYLEWPWLEQFLRQPYLGRRVKNVLGWKNKLPHVPRYRRAWPQFFRYYGGANHVILSREACSYMTRSLEAKRIIRWLRHSAHANEITFQSVILNSPLADTVVNANLREIVFPAHAPHPRTLLASDFDRLVRSDSLYARKFDESVDALILDRLEEHLAVESTPTTRSHVLS